MELGEAAGDAVADPDALGLGVPDEIEGGDEPQDRCADFHDEIPPVQMAGLWLNGSPRGRQPAFTDGRRTSTESTSNAPVRGYGGEMRADGMTAWPGKRSGTSAPRSISTTPPTITNFMPALGSRGAW